MKDAPAVLELRRVHSENVGRAERFGAHCAGRPTILALHLAVRHIH